MEEFIVLEYMGIIMGEKLIKIHDIKTLNFHMNTLLYARWLVTFATKSSLTMHVLYILYVYKQQQTLTSNNI